jgi:septal ring factor EnvC (AmiA/AmiB activator)
LREQSIEEAPEEESPEKPANMANLQRELTRFEDELAEKDRELLKQEE